MTTLFALATHLPRAALLCACTLASLGACGDNDASDQVELAFRVVVNGQPAACGTTYQNIGTTQSTFSLRDLKMYVSDVALLHGSHQHEVELEQDGVWQRDTVALLDFEDGSGDCSQGTAETNLVVRGISEDAADATGVAFTIGLPAEVNHLDAATAPAPLNAPGMWWSWKGGYKFLRLDAKTRGNPAYFLHLGSAACTGDSTTGYSCAKGNAPRIELTGVDLDRSTIVLDLGKLWADVDLDRQIDMQTDFVQGCMAGPTDPECPPVFSRLGLDSSGNGGALQSVFSVGTR